MPNRVIREGLIDSERICSLSPLARDLYTRLLLIADDFGRMDGRPSWIKSHCYPVPIVRTPGGPPEVLPLADFDACLKEIISADRVVVYDVDGKPFAAIVDFRNKPRAQSSRYPPPPGVADTGIASASTCAQMRADAPSNRNRNRNRSSNREPEPKISPVGDIPPAAPPKPARKPRKPDPIWDAVVLEFGLKVKTEAARKRIGQIVRELKGKDATGPEIAIRAARYRRVWPNVTCTARALMTNWETFANEPDPNTIGQSKADSAADRRLQHRRDRDRREYPEPDRPLPIIDLGVEPTQPLVPGERDPAPP